MTNHYGYIVFPTALGHCGLAWAGRGIARLQLPGADAGETEKLLLKRFPSSTIAVPDTRTREVIAMITRYFSGEAIDFTPIELDLAGQERFFLDVYEVARQIGWGRTTTYGGIVKDLGLGMEKARDVGQAMAKNPVPLIIPCHRVLAAGGRLGGFSAPGGTTTKLRMLDLENAGRNRADEAQGSLF
ncbi:methylated-DNA--[protein]-cysteine S-methyltransferase [Agrobacterium genomosp. 3 str. CIP 111-78]|uniref:Methylated-DNA--[protein]-cysteine S-methyltransferase n=1 Tax=Agrobacterium tumefaciens TaxID=358 RepID=A0AAE6BNG4_AGRTU|nr:MULTISPECIES: methylated-DNA--[protein]-cysteine S-methyltransferase [Agrobacterium tumefaciens complex]MCA2374017.1 methylated-DNA--[protein]-cysteine S-methyltransferase [Agrobacterium tomkonis CIP 111-78]QCM01372.1 methylated-DNA--[protein]-cysteine S-methyltransferase [Agrobacterium tumefaciens]